jgi:outer membrane protein assembly factor BamB
VATSAAPLASGDWTTFKGDAQRTGARAVAVALPLNLLWRHSTTADPNTATSPLVTGERGSRRVYFAAGATVFCVDGETGAQVWKSQVLTRPVTAPLSYVQSDKGDMVIAVTSGGQLSALRVADGGQVWTADARSPVQAAAPVLVQTPGGPRIVVGVAIGQMLAYTLDGALDPDWKVQLGRTGAAPTSTPALSADGTRLYLTGQDQKLYSIDVTKGQVEYTVQLPTASFSSPMVIGEQIVVTAGEIVAGYRQRTGDPIWRVNTGGRQISASPSGTIGPNGQPIVYVGARNGVFFSIDASNGNVIWKRELGESVTGTASLASNAIFVGTGRGVLYALNPTDGSSLWQYRLNTERQVTAPNPRLNNRGGRTAGGAGSFRGAGGRGAAGGRFGRIAPTTTQTFGVSSPPVIVGGQAYLLADNVALYCFDNQAFDAAPPRVVEPSMSVPGREGGLVTRLIDANRPLLIPGKAPVYFAAKLDDNGSGIDPASVQVQLNNEALPAERASYSAGTGVLTVTLNPAGAGGAGVNLPDGNHSVIVNARDYSGNALRYSGRFTVDNATPPPTNQQQQRRRGFGGRGAGGGGGSAGGGYPGAGGGSGYPGGGGYTPGS